MKARIKEIRIGQPMIPMELEMPVLESEIKNNQPERSKREDSKRNPFLDEIPECFISDEMRCSEQCGNALREVQ